MARVILKQPSDPSQKIDYKPKSVALGEYLKLSIAANIILSILLIYLSFN